MTRRTLLLLALLSAVAAPGVAGAAPSHRIASVAIPDGSSAAQAFWVDAFGQLWGSECPSCGWDYFGYAGGTTRITGGISTVAMPSDGVSEAWVIGENGRLYVLYYSSGWWYWQDEGMPPCGPLVGGPSMAAFGTLSSGYLGGVALCQNGNLAEIFYNPSAGWLWIDHGRPSRFVGGRFVPVGLVGEPGFTASESFIGAAIRGNDGSIWALSFDRTHGWDNWSRVGSFGSAFSGSPGMFSTAGGSVGGLVTTASGAVHSFSRVGSSWSWSNLGSPSGCSAKGDISVTTSPRGDVYSAFSCTNGVTIGLFSRFAQIAGGGFYASTSGLVGGATQDTPPQASFFLSNTSTGEYSARIAMHGSNGNTAIINNGTSPYLNYWGYTGWSWVY
jgi:hypothetical protein